MSLKKTSMAAHAEGCHVIKSSETTLAYSINEWKPRIHSAPLPREPDRAVALGRLLVLTWPNVIDLFIATPTTTTTAATATTPVQLVTTFLLSTSSLTSSLTTATTTTTTTTTTTFHTDGQLMIVFIIKEEEYHSWVEATSFWSSSEGLTSPWSIIEGIDHPSRSYSDRIFFPSPCGLTLSWWEGLIHPVWWKLIAHIQTFSTSTMDRSDCRRIWV
jgi:hypothetical protein